MLWAEPAGLCTVGRQAHAAGTMPRSRLILLALLGLGHVLPARADSTLA
ncbi:MULTISPECIES: hypothetical protein [unclassified Synechococcus]|nr:hypothetical protein [Synechococcus sp. A10-1-5-1]UPM50910.1 hypothetical protein MY494_03755 [Synechococcus sp. A10-1-5-1]